MAPRAYGRGYLKLSLVSCPIALFRQRPSGKNQIPAQDTGIRIKYHKVDADTGDESRLYARVSSELS
jgi:DNA end-binding protein Ku